MLVQPHAAPWEGTEGQHQCALGVENACALALRFAADSCDLIILDFLWEYTVEIYRTRLAALQPMIVQLLPSLPELLRRNKARGWLPPHEVEMLYAVATARHDYDHRIDNTHMPLDELSQQLLALMERKQKRA
jgi:chloramphenicol 3-O-phosphotransferase